MRALSLMALFVLAAASLAVASGCGGTPAAASSYAGTVWTLDRIVGADGTVTRGSGEERLTFGADGRLALSSCNECGGAYRLDGPTLAVDPAMACTRRGCPDGAIELERYVSGTQTLHREGAYLVLEPAGAPGAAAQLVFVPETAGPTAP